MKLVIYVLLKVNHRANRILFAGKEMTISAGSGIFGIDQIVRDFTGLQRKKSKKYQKFRILYYRRLQTLQNMGFLKLKPYNKFTVISIVNWEKYQAKREKCNSNVTQVKLKCNSNVTKQEVYKNEKNETTTSPDVAAVISEIFKGRVRTDKVKDQIQGKDPDEAVALAYYCAKESTAKNPVGLFFTMLKDGTKPPIPAGKREIPPPAEGYQTGEGPLLIDESDQTEKARIEEKKIDEGDQEEEESDEEFQERMQRDLARIKEECKSGNLSDSLHKQLERLKQKRK